MRNIVEEKLWKRLLRMLAGRSSKNLSHPGTAVSQFASVAEATAIMFENFGPYHLARITAAADAAKILAVEERNRSLVYEWSPIEIPEKLSYLNLGSPTNPMETEAALERAFSAGDPRCFALPGWSSPASLTALRWCHNRRIPTILMSESNTWDFKRVFYRERIKRGLVAHFSAALVTSDSQASYLESLGMPAEAIYRGYNAVDNLYFKSAAASAKNGPMPTVNGTSLSEQCRGRYFLASARLVAKKNLAALIRGFEQFRRSLEGGELCPPLVILGDGELRAHLENLTQQLGLERDILFAGFRQVDELPTFYGTAGAFIHVSTTEQWGLVVNEAMASGLPVAVSTRCGCAEVLVEDGHTGYLLDPFDENDICRAFRRLHGSNCRDQLGRRGQDRVFEWGPERFARGLKQAAEHAARVGVPRVNFLDMLTLRAAAGG